MLIQASQADYYRNTDADRPNGASRRISCGARALLTLMGLALNSFPCPPASATLPAASFSSQTVTLSTNGTLSTPISTTGTDFSVQGTASVTLEASSEVCLEPGFTAVGGGSANTFRALIGQPAPGPEFTIAPGLPSATTGYPYSQTLTATGGTGIYTWSIVWPTSNALPPGISFASGQLSGTPTASGTYQFTVLVSDSSGNAASQLFTLLVIQQAAPLSPTTSLQINLGFVPIDKYSYSTPNLHTTYGVPYVANCSTAASVRSCYQQVFSGLRSQSVQGVRFQFGYCGGAWSTALNGCGGSSVTLNQSWVASLSSFFQDLYANGLYQVTPTQPGLPLIDGFAPYCADGTSGPSCPPPPGQGTYGTCQTLGFITDSKEPGLDDGVQCVDNIPDPCTTTTNPLSVFYRPGVPYGEAIYTGDPTRPWGDWRAGYNQSYNCSMANPNFVGWNAIYSVWSAIFSAAHSNSIQIHEFDLLNEINLLACTVRLRYITDNTCPGGDCAVLSQAQNLMSVYFNGGMVTASQLDTASSLPGYDCGSFCGDSARVIHFSEMISALSGGPVGYPGGLSQTNGLWCCNPATGCTITGGGSNPNGGNVILSNMVSQSTVYSQPVILDYHPYDALGVADAATTFSDVYSLISSFGPTGWHGFIPNIFGSEVMLGETHSGTVNPVPIGGTFYSCEGVANPAALPGIEISGFDGSTLANETNPVVFRPWWVTSGGNSGCYPLHPQVNPPYIPTP